ncbi:hypothetical protein OCA8868_02297 [Octadecabacter ascidiaceicola]|uniref:Uncharacterized protein n=1 Tax=Octadecabacter ascidiaceicola TaxID=1655543 RepID=A0A238KBC9_9RHOB|nr:hypothetical protein OCA8868_02297 [Octadecabacter ascidiaceicola]
MSATLSHSGLPFGIKRTQFIDLVKPALKARGLKTSAIEYLAKTFDKWARDQDYEPGRICGFWHQVSGLADMMTCTVRTVHSIECDLVDATMVSRHPKANAGATVYARTTERTSFANCLVSTWFRSLNRHQNLWLRQRLSACTRMLWNHAATKSAKSIGTFAV